VKPLKAPKKAQKDKDMDEEDVAFREKQKAGKFFQAYGFTSFLK
jgi:hypothetical protein